MAADALPQSGTVLPQIRDQVRDLEAIEGGTEPDQGLRDLRVGLLIANAIAAACYGPRGEFREKRQGQLEGTR